jgi:DNA sulfur modification protein DndD
MIFERLLIQNLGIFRGAHCLELLPPDAKRPIVLVGALNGSGKTTVIESIQLALYGKRAGFGWRGATAYAQYLLQVRNRNATPTEETVAEVTLRLVDGRRLRVRRQWSFTKDAPREYVSVFVNGEEQPDLGLSESWDDEIERILPARLAELFFFDGERIESLADSARSGAVLRTAVASLLGLDLVDQLAGDLEILRQRQRQRWLAPEDQTLQRDLDTELEAKQQALADLKLRMAELRNRIDRARFALDQADQKSKEQGGEHFLKRDQMIAERAKLEEQLHSTEERLREAAAGALPLALVSTQLEELQRKLEEQAASLSHEASAAVQHQLKQMKAWVRKQDFPKKVSEEITEYLTRKLEQLPEPQADGIPLDWHQLAAQVTALLEARLSTARARATQLMAGSRKYTQKLGALDEQLQRVPEQEQVAAVFKEQGAADAALKGLLAELAVLEADEQVLLRRLSEIGRQRQELFAKVVDAGDAQRTVEYCERASRTLADFRTRLIKKRREQLETLILEAFRMLSRKPNLIGQIRLDPDTMMLTLLTGEGELLATQQLSAGERQLLAVAMLWGLARASGRPVPVVIDTPLGRLDGEHRRALVERYFPDASHQVILLSTDQEVDADYSRLLEDSVAHRYLIDYSPHERTSSFSLGYFPEVTPDAH